MRYVLFATAVVFASGCASSPRTTIWSDQADQLQVYYTSSADQLADSLVSRGCVPRGDRRFACTLPGQDLSVAVRLSRSTGYVPRRQERTEATEVAGRDTDQGKEDFITADGERVNTVADDEVRPPSLSRTSVRTSAAKASPLEVHASIRDGDMLVLLGGDEAQALRASLDALLVQGLPAVRANYHEIRMRR